jgi:hypothetical protein
MATTQQQLAAYIAEKRRQAGLAAPADMTTGVLKPAQKGTAHAKVSG